ncbi:hypothetical protein [Longibaculum muris]|uniref:hypothetical protein n=1 Tax=Longibaculum muris TaxID=1796628 RepID=UPI00294384EE|nr:hypothetical protein [Longibaculum muris]
MFEKKYHLYLTEEERNQVIHSLIDLKNNLIKEGKHTDLVDETLCKLIEVKIKKVKVTYKKNNIVF